MVVKGLPWDEVYFHYNPQLKKAPEEKVPQDNVEISDRSALDDIKDVSKRVAFGAICGSLTGFAFGTIEVLRDVKAMTGKKQAATAKVLRFGGMFGGFFAGYHGVRKLLYLYNPQPPEVNMLTASFISLAPLIAVGSLRAMLPYGVMLIVLDALNGINDS